jgi:DNA (cytosine-5)-methyltransferase 1
MRVLSLCSGIGGIDIACEWAGMEIVGQVEIDPYCQKILQKHWPNVKRISNVYDVRGDEFGTINIITAGIPCQPYSCAGKRRGAADDRAIWPQVFEIIKFAKPAWTVIENVAGFVSLALDQALSDLESQGYEVQAFVIPACGVDAPHLRKRVFLVAHSRSRGFGKQDICSQQQGRAEIICTGEIISNTNKQHDDNTRHGTSEICGEREKTKIFRNLANTDNRSGIMRRDRELSATTKAKRTWNYNRGRTSEYVTGEWWDVEPELDRVANGIPSILDGGGINEQGSSKESSTKGSDGGEMREMRQHKEGATASSELRGIHESIDIVPEVSQGTTHEGRNLGDGKKEISNSKLYNLRKTVYAKRFTYPQNVRFGLPENIRENTGKQEMASQWNREPNIPRVVSGIKNRVDRLKCLGNAVVPQQAYPIFQAIADIENEVAT